MSNMGRSLAKITNKNIAGKTYKPAALIRMIITLLSEQL